MSSQPPAGKRSERDQHLFQNHNLGAGSQRSRRLTRTILLGALAVAAAIAWLARELDMDADVLLGYAFTSLVLVGLAVLLAVAGAALVWLIRRLLR